MSRIKGWYAVSKGVTRIQLYSKLLFIYLFFTLNRNSSNKIFVFEINVRSRVTSGYNLLTFDYYSAGDPHKLIETESTVKFMDFMDKYPSY